MEQCKIFGLIVRLEVQKGQQTPISQFHRLIWVIRLKLAGYVAFLITSKVLDVRRRGATTEAYGLIRRKEERSKATQSFDFAQDREPVERQMMP
jgi:hypothetical protein